MKRESWAALTVGLLLAYGCAEPEPLGSVFRIDLSANPGDAGPNVDPGAGGTAPDPQGQGGSGPTPGTGGTGGTGATPGTGGTGPAPSTGGTGGAPGTGGTAGAPGAGGTAPGAGGTAAVPAGNCVETGSVTPFNVQLFYTDNSQANQIGIELAILNQGNTTYPMSDLAIRYWFTPGALTGFVGEVDNARSNSNVDVRNDVEFTFGEELGSSFVEIAVNRADAIGNGIDNLQVRIHTPAFGTLDHTDDFSYVQGAENVDDNLNITAYVDGVQVFGCEPPAQ